jgi:putative transposase
LSAVLGISREWLYKHLFLQKNKDNLLKEQILSVLAEFPSYGHRRIALALGLGKKRVRRCMHTFGIKPYKRKARWRKRRDERRAPAPFPNHIKNICPIVPNIVWVSDFTYIKFQGKFVYLATVMDLFTREIVGWHISEKHTTNLVLHALIDGIKNRHLEKPLYIHSDQGVEYTSEDYVKATEKLGITISLSKKASPWENGFQESFFNNFKTDLGLEFDRFESEGHLMEAIHHTVNVYNKTRMHTTLGMPPNQFRLRNVR